MSKKAKAEIADESAVIITYAVLAENQAKLDSYEKSIKAAQERRRKVIIESNTSLRFRLKNGLELTEQISGLWTLMVQLPKQVNLLPAERP